MSKLDDLLAVTEPPVAIWPDGTISLAPGFHSPDVWIDLDGHGNAEGEPYSDDPAWELLTGHTNQYGYDGALLHPSEVIGGSLEAFLLARPGIYAAVPVTAVQDGAPDPEPLIGWALLRQKDDQ